MDPIAAVTALEGAAGCTLGVMAALTVEAPMHAFAIRREHKAVNQRVDAVNRRIDTLLLDRER